MQLFTYVVEHDYGFAPNPFFGVCTLATCKPKIRSTAKLGDLLVGFGCAKRGRHGHLVYFMKVTRETDFNHYWLDPVFASKRPLFTGSKKQMFGDNIYHLENGRWIQENSLHSLGDGKLNKANLKRDTSTTTRVLMSDDFSYWGGEGPKLPKRFRNFSGTDIYPGRGHKCRFSEQVVRELEEWLRYAGNRGFLGKPTEWKYLP